MAWKIAALHHANPSTVQRVQASRGSSPCIEAHAFGYATTRADFAFHQMIPAHGFDGAALALTNPVRTKFMRVRFGQHRQGTKNLALHINYVLASWHKRILASLARRGNRRALARIRSPLILPGRGLFRAGRIAVGA